jgi:hypothetical protein
LSGPIPAKLTALRDGTQSYIVFFVRDERTADFVFQCPIHVASIQPLSDRYSLYDDGAKPWAGAAMPW